MKTSTLFFLSILLTSINLSSLSAQNVFAEPETYNFSMGPSFSQLQTYDIKKDLYKLRKDYLLEGLPYYYPHKIWTTLDSKKIPLVTYPWGTYRNPITSAQTAYAFLADYDTTGSAASLDGFLSNARWLLKAHNDFYYEYHFDFNHKGALLDSGWVSGMAQGQILGIMVRAYLITGKIDFKKAADGIFETLHTNSADHWTIWVDDDYYYWLEEYPSSAFCHVLNGKLFALWCYWDYYVLTESDLALTLFLAGIRTIADHYPIWNVASTNNSYYCQHNAIIPKYHVIHQFQLKAYADFFGITEFNDAISLFTFPSIMGSPLPSDFPVDTGIDSDSYIGFATGDLGYYDPVTEMAHTHAESHGKLSNHFFHNYPNPFKSTTELAFELEQSGEVQVVIKDAQGRMVEVLADELFSAGEHTLSWTPSNIAAGMYIGEVTAGPSRQIVKLMYLGK